MASGRARSGRMRNGLGVPLLATGEQPGGLIGRTWARRRAGRELGRAGWRGTLPLPPERHGPTSPEGTPFNQSWRQRLPMSHLRTARNPAERGWRRGPRWLNAGPVPADLVVRCSSQGPGRVPPTSPKPSEPAPAALVRDHPGEAVYPLKDFRTQWRHGGAGGRQRRRRQADRRRISSAAGIVSGRMRSTTSRRRSTSATGSACADRRRTQIGGLRVRLVAGRFGRTSPGWSTMSGQGLPGFDPETRCTATTSR